MSLSDQMLLQARYTSRELNMISQEYKRRCGSSGVMSVEQFTPLFTELGCPAGQCHRLFRTLSSTHRLNQISLEDLTVGLCALDPNSPHAGIIAQFRCRFIFNFYNTSQSGRLTLDELGEMIRDICAAKRLTLDLQHAIYNSWQMFGVTKDEAGISVAKFLIAVDQLKFRGTSYLFRLPRPPITKKSFSIGDATPPVYMGGVVPPDLTRPNENPTSGTVGRQEVGIKSGEGKKEVGAEGADGEGTKKDIGEKGDSGEDGEEGTYDEGGEENRDVKEKGNDKHNTTGQLDLHLLEEEEAEEDGAQNGKGTTVETHFIKIVRVHRASTPTFPDFMKQGSNPDEDLQHLEKVFIDNRHGRTPADTVDTSRLDEMPLLTILEDFEMKDGTKINVLDKIGGKYLGFGIHLLKDGDGTITTTIKSDHHGDSAAIKREIVMRWLRGEGRMPVTWTTLIHVLKVIKFKVLAADIRAALIHNKRHED